MAMPTQRPPFFASFFSAFRARTSPTFQAKSNAPIPSLSPSIAAHAHVSTITTNATSTMSRSITTNTDTPSQIQQSQASLAQIGNSSSTKAPSAFSASAFASTSPGTHHSHSHPPFYSPRSPGTSSPAGGQTIPLTRGRQRRGSDSSNSSGGFMDALGSGNEKWYIGGRTAGGDERFYRLGLVTSGGTRGSRATSLDRLSL